MQPVNAADDRPCAGTAESEAQVPGRSVGAAGLRAVEGRRGQDRAPGQLSYPRGRDSRRPGTVARSAPRPRRLMLVPHKSAVDDFYDDAALRATYHAELIELLKRVTGAQRVEVFDDTRRSSSAAKQRERGARDPANIVHNDYTHASGHRRLADFFGNSPEELRQFEQRRFAIVNAWRPIGAPVVDHPLVLCDARTVRDGDLVPVERRGEDRTGELQVALHEPGQRWYYYPGMNRDEVLLFKTYDSALDGRARFTPHSSCKDPRAPEDAAPRESLETRCMVFFQ